MIRVRATAADAFPHVINALLRDRVQTWEKPLQAVSRKAQRHRAFRRRRSEQAMADQIVEQTLRRPDGKARDPRCLAAFDLATY